MKFKVKRRKNQKSIKKCKFLVFFKIKVGFVACLKTFCTDTIPLTGIRTLGLFQMFSLQ